MCQRESSVLVLGSREPVKTTFFAGDHEKVPGRTFSKH